MYHLDIVLITTYTLFIILGALAILYRSLERLIHVVYIALNIIVASISIAVLAGFSGNLATSYLYMGSLIPCHVFSISYIGLFTTIVISVMLVSLALYSIQYIKIAPVHGSRTYFWVLLYVIIGLVYIENITKDIIVYIAIMDLLGVSTALFISYEWLSRRSRFSAKLYLTIVLASSTLILVGYLSILSRYIFIATILVLIGLFLKLGLFPLYFWIPSVYSGAITPAIIMASSVIPLTGLHILVDTLLVYGVQQGLHLLYSSASIACLSGAVISLVAGITQRDLVKSLSYLYISLVNQVSYFIFKSLQYIVLQPAGAIVEPLVSLYLGIIAFYGIALSSSILFYLAGIVEAYTHTRDLYKIGGLRKYMSWSYMIYIILSLLIIGLPPSYLFTLKLAAYATVSYYEPLYYTLGLIAMLVTLKSILLVRLFNKIFIEKSQYSIYYRIVSIVEEHHIKYIRYSLWLPLATAMLYMVFIPFITPQFIMELVHGIGDAVLLLEERYYILPLVLIPRTSIASGTAIFIHILLTTTIPLSAFTAIFYWRKLLELFILATSLLNKYTARAKTFLDNLRYTILAYSTSVDDNYMVTLAVSMIMLLLLAVIAVAGWLSYGIQ